MSDFVQISQTSDDLDVAEGLKRDEDIATSRGSPIEENFSSNIDIVIFRILVGTKFSKAMQASWRCAVRAAQTARRWGAMEPTTWY